MIVEMKNVSFIREGRVILDRLHWEVQENEQWVILGLNGSGKTSLLNILLGYEYPSKGEVSVLGHRFGKTNLPELRKHIGFVSNSFERFQPTLESETVEGVIVSGKFASIGLYEPVTVEDFHQAEQWMNVFRIGYLKGKTYRTLSQGEKRKVLIARALMAKPKLLILDEPTVGLDMLTREELLALIKDVIMKKVCHVLYVTHYIEEIIEEMTHVLLLKDGKIIAAGQKEKILTDDYLSETFQIDVHVRWEHNRPWVSIKKALHFSK